MRTDKRNRKFNLLVSFFPFAFELILTYCRGSNRNNCCERFQSNNCCQSTDHFPKMKVNDVNGLGWQRIHPNAGHCFRFVGSIFPTNLNQLNVSGRVKCPSSFYPGSVAVEFLNLDEWANWEKNWVESGFRIIIYEYLRIKTMYQNIAQGSGVCFTFNLELQTRCFCARDVYANLCA